MKKGLLALLCLSVLVGLPACHDKDKASKAPKKERTQRTTKKHTKGTKDKDMKKDRSMKKDKGMTKEKGTKATKSARNQADDAMQARPMKRTIGY